MMRCFLTKGSDRSTDITSSMCSRNMVFIGAIPSINQVNGFSMYVGAVREMNRRQIHC
ncbi:hypothetical protein Mapa_002948 [Marchantia paleacea]|nr:hypothetical protein Mapa_002948 [Marchantia paleacea]